MARRIQTDVELDRRAFATEIERVLRNRRIRMSAEDIQEALKESTDGTYVEASVEEIHYTIANVLIPDDKITKWEENVFSWLAALRPA